MTADKPKLCVDCRHCEVTPADHICRHPSATTVNLVTGAMRSRSCSCERSLFSKEYCTAEGRFWEPKP